MNKAMIKTFSRFLLRAHRTFRTGPSIWYPIGALLLVGMMTSPTAAQEPTIQVGDRLEIVVQGHPTLSGVTEVQPDGRGTIPGDALIRLPMADRPLHEVEVDVITILEALLPDPAPISVRLLPREETERVTPPPPDDILLSTDGNPLVNWMIPGGGQFAAGRTGRGVLTLAIVGAGVGAALGIRNEEVLCAAPVDQSGRCPASDILDVTEERPFLIGGIAAAVAVTVISAIDAHSFVQDQSVSLSSRPVGAVGGIEFSLSIPVGPAVRGSGNR